jgi:hypothetical protein
MHPGGWQQQPQQQPGGFGGAPAGGAGDGMAPCQAAVLQIVSDPNAGDQGVHVNEVTWGGGFQGRTAEGRVWVGAGHT